MTTIDVTAQNFEQTVKQGIVLLDFWAPWCGPCRAFKPIFEATAQRHPDISFGKVNTEEQPELASAFGIQAIPTLMVFRDGIMLAAQPGMLPAQALEQLITKVRELDMDEIRREVARRQAKPGQQPASAAA